MIEERRRRLTSDMVQVLSCIKDWELADQHMQHNLESETKILEAMLVEGSMTDGDGVNQKQG